jgi:uncharacterized membrane protein
MQRWQRRKVANRIPNNNHDETLRIELFIARLLRWGVVLSFVIVAIGIGAVIVTGQTGYHQISLEDTNSIVRYHAGKPDFPNSLGDVFDGVLALRPYAIITLGVLVLIAIPVMRVAVSVIAFALERDRLYVLITAFVFAMLLLSFAIGEAGG